MVSINTFPTIPVMNKCLTVLLNTLIWDQHAKPGGLAYLFVCIAGGMIYQQAPMKSEGKPAPPITADDDEFKADIESDVPTTEIKDMTTPFIETSGSTKRRG